GKVKLQKYSGGGWSTIAVKRTDAKGKAVFKRSFAASKKFRVVGSSSTSHGQKLRYGARYSASPIAAVNVDPTAQADNAVAGSFAVSGSGWGHGVGMSQYGAQAMALAGRSAAQILKHYYTGASVATRSVGQDIRVQLRGGASKVTVTYSDGGRVRAGDAWTAVGAGGAVVLTPASGKLKVTLKPKGQDSQVLAKSADQALVEWRGTRYFQADQPGATVAVSGADVYRHGRIEASAIGGGVNVVGVMRLNDEYVNGIAEIPRSWSPAALQAQAIAARTYALRKSGAVRASCDCEVTDTTSDQVFAGWDVEGEPTWGERWKAAVAATSSKVVVDSQGNPITTYYSSSTGGRTENSEDVWVAAEPHLRSVADPWSLDPAARNPHAEWTATVSQAAMAKAFGVKNIASVKVTKRSQGGGAMELTAITETGSKAVIAGKTDQIRIKLGLRSAHITAIRAL
ncbi:MAG: SpoIID/LytB domain-containing protein, partial [Bifidobacteriaceae bacterium]|nr:SpoIID/LytB domain-containing protein [Bifidobacteriaceae bacterium]